MKDVLLELKEHFKVRLHLKIESFQVKGKYFYIY